MLYLYKFLQLNIMIDTSDTLYQCFKAVFSDAYIRDEKNDALVHLIVTNANYTSQFWSIQDNAGVTPLQWFCVNTNISLNTFAQHATSDPQVARLVFNTPNNKGQVLLHSLWEKYKKNGDANLGKHILLALEQTDTLYWKHWDNGGNHPGEGWMNQILHQQAASYDGTSFLNMLSQKIMQVFPPVINQDPHDSPWLTIKNSSQIQTLLDSGYTLYDTVCINQLEQPAWRMLLMCHGKKMFTSDVLDQLKPEDQEEYTKVHETFKSWQALAPNDRRAKIGYVRQVLEKTGQDFEGKNSLMYLLNHRSDLMALLHRELIYTLQPNEAIERVVQPDAAGYPLLSHAMFRGNLNEVAAVYQSFNLPLSLGCGEDGWFAHEKKSQVWFERVLGGGRNSLVSIKTLENFLILSQDPLALYGDATQQQKLSEQWEKILPRLPKMSAKYSHNNTYGASKITHEDEYFFRQALLFIEHETVIAPHLNPQLADQLKIAGVWARSMDGISKHWLLQLSGSKLKIENITPVTHITPGIEKFIENEGVTQMFRSAYNKNTLIENWNTAVQRAVLLSNIESPQTGSHHRRKM